jgi:hypothetical protein
VSVALITQHAKRMHRIILSLTSLAVPYFSTLSNTRQDSRKRIIEQETCVLILFTILSEKIVILLRM